MRLWTMCLSGKDRMIVASLTVHDVTVRICIFFAILIGRKEYRVVVVFPDSLTSPCRLTFFFVKYFKLIGTLC